MNPLLADIPLFVEAAKQLSFSKAAETLDLGISTVSRRIKRLEEKLGTPLFLRDTHSVQITDAGKLLLEHCEFILNTADNALESVARNVLQPSGRVRVSMYADTYYELMQGIFSNFTDRWPDIQLSVRFSEDSPDLLSEPYDVTFRIGPLPGSSMVAKKVLTIKPALYASPKLLEKYPYPEKPHDLYSMPCITLARFGSFWELRRGEHVAVVRAVPRFTFSSALLALEFGLGGHGVALLREELAAPHLERGELVRLLPQWTGPSHGLFILVGGKQVPQRVRVFVDYVLSRFASESDSV